MGRTMDTFKQSCASAVSSRAVEPEQQNAPSPLVFKCQLGTSSRFLPEDLRQVGKGKAVLINNMGPGRERL